jgi:hypothetical protein
VIDPYIPIGHKRTAFDDFMDEYRDRRIMLRIENGSIRYTIGEKPRYVPRFLLWWICGLALLIGVLVGSIVGHS